MSLEKINLEKRKKIIKTMQLGLGFLFLGTIFKSELVSATKKEKTIPGTKILKDNRGRIVEIVNPNGHFVFNPANPMEYTTT